MFIPDENLRLKIESITKLFGQRGLEVTDEDVLKVAAKLGIDMVDSLTPSAFLKYAK